MTNTPTATKVPTQYDVALNEAADELAELIMRGEITSVFMLVIQIRPRISRLESSFTEARQLTPNQLRPFIKRQLECRYNRYELARRDCEAMRWVLRG